MKKVLLITSSPRGESSLSTLIATEIANLIDDARVTTRALWRDPPPHIDPAWVGAAYTPERERTPEDRQILAYSDSLVAELFAAEVVVIAAGMINLGPPSPLKAWMDHITREDVTFRLTPDGAEGLIRGKRAILVMACGGTYATGPHAGFDFLEPWLRTLLMMLGVRDIETIRIEGVAAGHEAEVAALAAARARAADIARGLAGR